MMQLKSTIRLVEIRWNVILQWFRTLPFSEIFVGIVTPIYMTLVLSYIAFVGLSYLPISENQGMAFGMTMILGIPMCAIIYYIQQQFYNKVFTESLIHFISITKNNHPVTQKFATDLLSLFLEGNESIIDIIKENNKKLIDLTTALESREGIFMDDLKYTNILTKSVDYQPKGVFAVWNTDKFPLTNAREDYSTYFEVLSNLYRDITTDQKERIFVFIDESSYTSVSNSPIWKHICDQHKNEWHFTKIYFCYSSQFKTIKKQQLSSSSEINDFVHFKRGNKSEWIISRADDKKVCLYKNKTDIGKLSDFYKCLKGYCDSERQYIDL